MGTQCHLSLLDVTVQAQLEEMNPESESDGPNGEAGNASLIIYAVPTLWCFPDSPGCASTSNSPNQAK